MSTQAIVIYILAFVVGFASSFYTKPIIKSLISRIKHAIFVRKIGKVRVDFIDNFLKTSPNKVCVINWVLDTSGSFYGGDKYKEIVAYIFSRCITVNVIQIDHEIQSIKPINSLKEFNNQMFLGRGGTILQPAFDYISNPKNDLNMNNTILSTDGFTDFLDFSLLNTQVLILSTDCECPIRDSNNNVVQITNLNH